MGDLWLLYLNVGLGTVCGLFLCRLRYRARLGPTGSWLIGAAAGAAAGLLVFGFVSLMWLFNSPPPAEQIGISLFLLGGALTGFLLFGKRPA